MNTDEWYQSADYSYRIGHISFKELKRSLETNTENLSLVVIDDPLKSASSPAQAIIGNKKAQLHV